MKCPKCKKEMYCNNSRQRDTETIRYRSYVCRSCAEILYTIETSVDQAVGRREINKIIDERKIETYVTNFGQVQKARV